MTDQPQPNPAMPNEFSAEGSVPVERIEPFDVRETEGMNGLTKLAIFAGLLLLIAFVVLKLYQPGVRDRSDPPRITADNTPFKVPPKDAGGAQTPNQDKVVFEVMDGQSPDAAATPQPLPENPISVERPVINAPDPVVTTVEPVPVPTTRPVRTPTPRPTAPSSAVATGYSDYVVQIASLRSQSEADATYARLQRKFPSLLSELQSDVKRVDLDAKGIYYRARVSGLADKSAASDLCQRFKAAGQDCIVTRR
jgi:cell division protein FtsN